MRIQPISNHTAFQGLLGSTRKLVDTQVFYERDYDCNYYEREYRPFADETAAEINRNMKVLERKINEEERDPRTYCFSSEYVSLRLGRPLKITKSDYELLCNGVVPPILDEKI